MITTLLILGIACIFGAGVLSGWRAFEWVINSFGAFFVWCIAAGLAAMALLIVENVR